MSSYVNISAGSARYYAVQPLDLAMPMPFRVLSAQTLRSFGVVVTLIAFLLGQLIPNTSWAAAPARTALLGLDAADSNQGREVSDAIADSLDARNVLFRAPLTFAEYRLMMSCSPENNRCLGRAGDGFEASQILLGGLTHSGSEVQVKLRLIKNRSGALLAMERFVFKPENLKGEQLMTAAEYMVNTLFAEASGKPQPDFPFAPVITENTKPSAKSKAPVDDALPSDSSTPIQPQEPSLKGAPPSSTKLEPAGPVKRDRPRERSGVGLKVGLGVTAALAAVSFGTAIWTHRQLADDGRIRTRILEIAADSVSETDNDPGNDIHPMRKDNLCDIARMPRQSDPSKIRNEEMAGVCDQGTRLMALNRVSLVAGGVLLAGAAVLLGFVIHDARAKKRRRLSFDGSWSPGRGGYVSTKLRF